MIPQYLSLIDVNYFFLSTAPLTIAYSLISSRLSLMD